MSGAPDGTRIAMWSGPRNISTALMRSWEARGDTVVVDEPFYAHYLATTGAEHPGREEVVEVHETDWRAVVERLVGPVPGGKRIFYQKHMAHHLLPGMEGRWLERLSHAFLIRDPREMLTSLIRVTPDPSLADTGLPQQVRLFRRVQSRTGQTPPVIDARDVLEDPPGILERLCAALGVPYTDRMLTWEPGRRDTDGIWAKHWYGSVERSTGFEPRRPKPDRVPDRLSGVLSACRERYDELRAHRLTADEGDRAP